MTDALQDLSNVPTTAVRVSALRDVVWYGADPTGAIDSTSSVQAAFNAGCYKFPTGTFLLTSNIIVPDTVECIVEGEGAGATTLFFNSGGLVLPCNNPNGTNNASLHNKGVRGLTLVSAAVGTETAIKIYRYDDPNYHYVVNGVDLTAATQAIDTKILIEDIEIVGADGIYGTVGVSAGSTKYWGTGIDLVQVRFVSLDNVMIYGGGAGRSPYGLRIRSTASDPQFRFSATGLGVNGFTVGVDVEGWIEGIYWDAFEVWGCRDAFSATRGTWPTVGTFLFANGHFNGSRNTVLINGYSNISFVNMSLNRGFIEPEYLPQDGGAFHVTSPTSQAGYHYAGNVLTVKNAMSDGQIQLANSRVFSAFRETSNFVEFQSVQRFSVTGVAFYGPATTSALRLSGTTTKGSWDNIVVDNNSGGTIASAVVIDSTCSEVCPGTVVYSNANILISDSGGVIGRHRASFLACANASIVDVTGDGTFYVPKLNTISFNYGNGYSSSTGQFVAPVSGVYELNFSIKVFGLQSNHTDGSAIIVTPQGNRTHQFNTWATATPGGTSTLSVSATAMLAAGQSAYPMVTVNGGSKVVDILGFIDNTSFDGHLIREI